MTLLSVTRLVSFIHSNSYYFQRSFGFGNFFLWDHPEEPTRIGDLWSVVENLQEGKTESASLIAEKVIREMPSKGDAHGAIPVKTFAEALLARIHRREGGGNLYVNARPSGEQLRAFNVLATRTPVIKYGHSSANQIITNISSCLNRDNTPIDLAIVDIGIGMGGQICHLIQCEEFRKSIRSLRVIGVDVNSNAVTVAQKNICGIADTLNLPIKFENISKHAEDLTVKDFASAKLSDYVIATSSFALHHIGDGNTSSRDVTLRLLRSVASHLVIVEPDSNHFIDNLMVRFLYAYRHYRTLFAMLTKYLPTEMAHLVWDEFFAPEIRNVISFDNEKRVERHEELNRWKERLVASNWHVDNVTSYFFNNVSLLGVIGAR